MNQDTFSECVRCTWSQDAGTSRLLYKLGYVQLQGKGGLHIPLDACFFSDNTLMTTVVFRDMIKYFLCSIHA